VELRQLRYFIAVAEELNFHRAAERVNISQPPLSRQVALLENELGAELFVRAHHRVQLTEAGRVFLAHARMVIAAAQTAVDAAGRAVRGEVGTLTVGFVGSAIYSCIPRILPAFRERYPDVHLTLNAMSTTAQIEALRKQQLDIGLLRHAVRGRGLATEFLLRERFVVALPATHPMARRRVIALRSLADERFVMFQREDGPGPYTEILDLCRRENFTPRVVQEAGPMTIHGLVASGLGIAIVPEGTRCIHFENVVYRRLADAHAQTEFRLIWRRDNESTTVANFVQLAKEAMVGGAPPA